MNDADFNFFGTCPQYDTVTLAKCLLCQKIIKLNFFAQHLELKHDMKLNKTNDGEVNETNKTINEASNNNNNNDLEITVIDDDDLHETNNKTIKNDEDNDQNLPLLSSLFDNNSKKSSPIKIRKTKTIANTENTDEKYKKIVQKLKNKFSINQNSSLTQQSPKSSLLDGIEQVEINKKDVNLKHDLVNGMVSAEKKASSSLNSNISVTTTTTKVAAAATSNEACTSQSKSKKSTNIKVYDADKHCGVVLNGAKPCMRSLTCKKHSINLRRLVEGRSRSFNELFKQYRDQKLQKQQVDKPQLIKSTTPTATTSILSPKTNLKDNLDTNSLTKVNLNECFSKFENKSELIEEKNVLINGNENGNGTSLNDNDSNSSVVSNNSDDVFNFDDESFQYPRPLAISTFGGRYLDKASNFIVWNHRQDHMRAVLVNTFNNYLNKKHQSFEMIDKEDKKSVKTKAKINKPLSPSPSPKQVDQKTEIKSFTIKPLPITPIKTISSTIKTSSSSSSSSSSPPQLPSQIIQTHEIISNNLTPKTLNKRSLSNKIKNKPQSNETPIKTKTIKTPPPTSLPITTTTSTVNNYLPSSLSPVTSIIHINATKIDLKKTVQQKSPAQQIILTNKSNTKNNNSYITSPSTLSPSPTSSTSSSLSSTPSSIAPNTSITIPKFVLPKSHITTITATTATAASSSNSITTNTPSPIIINDKPLQQQNIKLIQTFPLSSSPTISKTTITSNHVNGNKRAIAKKPQLIVPKTTPILTTKMPITKTTTSTKISPKAGEYIILNGGASSSSSTPLQNTNQITLNGVNKLTVISASPTQLQSYNHTNTNNRQNFIQTTALNTASIQIKKRSIDSISSTSSSGLNQQQSSFNDNNSYSFNSPKYIKLNHSTSNGAIATSNNYVNLAQSPSLLITPIATASTSTTSSASNTQTASISILKAPISKVKIPINTNISK